MVNPRYRPTIANSRKPIGSKKEIGEVKKDFVYPPKEKYIGSHIKSKLGKKKPQDVAKKYIGQDINTGKLQTGDATTAANIANWDRGMKRIADAGGVANLRKGGLVKSGKPKLAKKGWK